MKTVLQYTKGILATAVTFLGSLSVALPDGVTGQEWITIAIATLTAAGVVLGVPNAAKPAAAP